MLIKIFQNRHLKNRRPELAADEKKILADFSGGQFQKQSAKDVFASCRQSLLKIE